MPHSWRLPGSATPAGRMPSSRKAKAILFGTTILTRRATRTLTPAGPRSEARHTTVTKGMQRWTGRQSSSSPYIRQMPACMTQTSSNSSSRTRIKASAYILMPDTRAGKTWSRIVGCVLSSARKAIATIC